MFLLFAVIVIVDNNLCFLKSNVIAIYSNCYFFKKYYFFTPAVESNDNLAVVRSILTSLGQLKLVTPTVLDMISDWYSKR